MGVEWEGDIRFPMEICFSTRLGLTKTAVRTAETVRQQRTRYLKNPIYLKDLIFLIKKVAREV